MNTIEILVPCFNESDVLDMFYNEVSAVMKNISGYEYSFIFVNDGSSDNTLEIIKNLSEKDERVKYISFSRNFGKEAAMLAGLRYSCADYVVLLDADLQHSPDLIPQMLLAVTEEGYDVAAAKRTDRKGEAGFKSMLSQSFYKVANKLTEVEIDNGAQDFRLMKRKVVEAILSLSEHNRFTKGIFSWVGFKTKWFEHENRERAAGETKWNITKLFKYALDGILSFSSSPLHFPFYSGIVCEAATVIYLVLYLVLRYAAKISLSFAHPIIMVMLLLCGIVLISLGIIGEYLSRIYSEEKGRPIFIVDETNVKSVDKQDIL